MISDYFIFVFRTFRHRQLRSWLTVVGILIGIAAVVALISLGQGVQHAVNSAFSTIGTDKLIVTPGGFMGPSSSGLLTAKITEKDVETIKNVRGVEHTITILSKKARAEFKGQTKFVSVYGASIEKETVEIAKTISMFQITEGRFLKETDKYNMVIGYRVSNDLFDTPVGINDKMVIEGKTFTVVGVQKKSGSPMQDSVVRMPLESAREILNEPIEISLVFVKVKDGYSTEKVKLDIEDALRKERDVEKGEEDFSVTSTNQMISSINSILNVVQMGIIGIASISLIVGALGIMNTMYTAVAERTKEIGVMKAIGATNWDIILLFTIESGMLGLLGGTIGIIIGFILSKIVEIVAANTGFEILKAYMSVELVVVSLVFSFIIGAASGVLPARHAASLKPVEAMRR